MREKERYLLLEWRKKRKEQMNFAQVQDLVHKDFYQVYGEMGLAVCGPRFKLYPLLQSSAGGGEDGSSRYCGICIRVRREAAPLVSQFIKTLKGSFALVHVAGSARQATRAYQRKLNPQLTPAEASKLPWL